MAWPNDEVPGVPAGGYIQDAIRERRKMYEERNRAEEQRANQSQNVPFSEAYGRGGIVGVAGEALRRAYPLAREASLATARFYGGPQFAEAVVPRYGFLERQAAESGRPAPMPGAPQPQPGVAQQGAVAPQQQSRPGAPSTEYMDIMGRFGGGYTPQSAGYTMRARPAAPQSVGPTAMPRPGQRIPEAYRGVFYARPGEEGNVMRYAPGSTSPLTSEQRAAQRVQDAMRSLGGGEGEIAIGPNGQRMQLPTNREIMAPAPTQTPKQQEFLNRAVARMQDASTRFLTPQAEAAARSAERDLQIRNEARNLRGITNRERAAYERELRSLQGPQEQERRKQEQAAERIAKASNPPQIVRGEKPPGPDEMVPRAKQYYDSVKDSVNSDTATYLSNELTGMSDEEAKQILGILSGSDGGIDLTQPPSPNDTDIQKKRKNLYAIVLQEAGPDVANDLFNQNPKK